jgi:hypothetical protein
VSSALSSAERELLTHLAALRREVTELKSKSSHQQSTVLELQAALRESTRRRRAARQHALDLERELFMQRQAQRAAALVAGSKELRKPVGGDPRRQARAKVDSGLRLRSEGGRAAGGARGVGARAHSDSASRAHTPAREAGRTPRAPLGKGSSASRRSSLGGEAQSGRGRSAVAPPDKRPTSKTTAAEARRETSERTAGRPSAPETQGSGLCGWCVRWRLATGGVCV